MTGPCRRKEATDTNVIQNIWNVLWFVDEMESHIRLLIRIVFMHTQIHILTIVSRWWLEDLWDVDRKMRWGTQRWLDCKHVELIRAMLCTLCIVPISAYSSVCLRIPTRCFIVSRGYTLNRSFWPRVYGVYPRIPSTTPLVIMRYQYTGHNDRCGH